MAIKSTQRDKRRMRGFERADGLLAGRIAHASEGRGFTVARLLTHWPEVAGEDLARATRPIRIGYGKGGFGATLTLLVRGAEAPMIQTALPQLLKRVNACYGYAAVARITLTQTAPTGFAEGQADFQHRAPAPTPKGPSAAVLARSEGLAGQVTDPELKLALSRLGAHILSAKTDEEKA